jgi:cation:H+ antiporter
MAIVVHISTFLVSAAVIWFFAGLLIGAVDRIAKRFHKSDFTIAFFVLGFLTSISEISVAINSTLDNVPQVSAGNLIGASFVLLLFIVPIIAIAGKGAEMRNTLSRRNLLFALGLILLPSLLIIDGDVTRQDGLIIIAAYITLLYLIRVEKSPLKDVQEVKDELFDKKKTAWDATKILIGAALIFIAGHFLVQETVFFANALSVPGSLIGLILLSIGTNIPEIAIGFRAIYKKHKDVALGDYLGSAVTNVPIFGILALTNGPFRIEASEFVVTIVLMILGLGALYVFAGSKKQISRKEGVILLVFYAVFLVVQMVNLARFAAD